MSLADLIRKTQSVKVATAIPAIRATPDAGEALPVAGTATIAVANPADRKSESCRWTVHFADAEPQEVICHPPATHTEMLERYPAAVAAEPVEAPTPVAHPMTAREEAAVRAWLASIGETDAEAIGAVLRQCREDAEARCWYFDPERAGALVLPDPDPQDCRNCTHWRRPGLSDGYCTARTDLPAVTALLHELPADNGATCATFKDWRGWGPGG